MRPDLQTSQQFTLSTLRFRLALVFLFILHPSSFILAQSPVLRIETGMHTATITRIGVDAGGKFLVTASTDKTARVWDIATGELLRVLRPPLGAGDEGKLLSVAISPDSNTVAVGGWTGYEWDKTHSIYLFDRVSGRLVRRLGNLPGSITHLVFSSDSKYLAATLSGANGVRVYETVGWQQIGVDTDYSKGSYGADFDRNGRLVTSCLDGFIRLYAVGQRGLQRLAKKKTSGGKLLYSVKFSPDSGKIAVGVVDSTDVSVLSAADLSLLFAPDTSGVNNGDLFSVAWSATGDILYAGGKYQTNGNRQIRFWANGGRGGYQETNAALNTVFDIQPLPNGGVIYGTLDPTWGAIDESGKRSRLVVSGIPYYFGLLENFRISNNGAEIGFGYEPFGKSAARFSLVERRLVAADDNNARLQSPRTNTLNITDWLSDDNITFYEPKLNGSKLRLRQYETSRSLAIAPDNLKFLLGTEFSILLFDRMGKELWRAATPGVAWAVNLSGDGRLAVAAFGDGTIRWYRVTDGAELLALFPHGDRKRWVLWTPQGYYDASAGAEDLIGWHVNNGPDAAADFYPLARFFEQYYRPDIVSEVLATASTVPEVLARRGEKERAQAAVAIRRPPRVAFLAQAGALATDAEQFELCLAAEDLGGGVDEVRLYQNNKLVTADAAREIGLGAGAAKSIGCNADTRQIGLGAGQQQQRRFVVTLLEGVNQFRGIGLSQDRIESAPAEIVVTLRGDVTQTADLHLLTVGINRYKNPDMSLNFAEPDANGIRDFFASAAPKKLFRNTVFHHLLNENAKLADIRKAFAAVQAQAKPQDVVVVYFAGHGTVLDNIWYFVPHDMTAPEDDAAIKNGSFSTIELAQSLRAIKAQKIFVMIDACKSGGALLALRGVEDRKALAQLARSTGTYLIAASTDTQLAIEVKALGHGVFTHVLLEGLKGKAGAGKITVEAVMQYVKNALPDVSEKYRSRAQYPVSQGYGTDFPLAVY